jgi:hypothetical protein
VVLLLLDMKAAQRIRQRRYVGVVKSSTAWSGGEKQLGGAIEAETDGDRAMSARSASRLLSGAHGALGVQRTPIGGPRRRERSLTNGPLSIPFHNEIKSPEIELTAGKIAQVGENFP